MVLVDDCCCCCFRCGLLAARIVVDESVVPTNESFICIKFGGCRSKRSTTSSELTFRRKDSRGIPCSTRQVDTVPVSTNTLMRARLLAAVSEEW